MAQTKIKQPTTLNLKLASFDGPIDLLSSLIKEHKMNILDLDIAMLAKQYLAFIQKNIDGLSIEEASEYMIMATYLLELKSKKVLPIENLDESSNFEYERDKLVRRIIEYQKYKSVIPKILSKQENRLQMYGKKPDDLEAYAPKELILEKLPTSIPINHLLKVLESAFEKWKMSLFSQQKILVQELSVEDVQKDILDFLEHNSVKESSFSEFLNQIDELKISQQYIVTCFLALLELVKYQKINLLQKQLDDDIFFSKAMIIQES